MSRGFNREYYTARTLGEVAAKKSTYAKKRPADWISAKCRLGQCYNCNSKHCTHECATHKTGR